MLYSFGIGVLAYYAMLAAIGFLVNCQAVEGSIMTFVVICFVGAYLVRSYSQLVFRLAMGLGIAAVVVLLAGYFLLPVVSKTGIVWVAVIAAAIVYAATRRFWFRRYIRRRDGSVPFPPFGMEFLRWVAVFGL